MHSYLSHAITWRSSSRRISCGGRQIIHFVLLAEVWGPSTSLYMLSHFCSLPRTRAGHLADFGVSRGRRVRTRTSQPPLSDRLRHCRRYLERLQTTLRTNLDIFRRSPRKLMAVILHALSLSSTPAHSLWATGRLWHFRLAACPHSECWASKWSLKWSLKALSNAFGQTLNRNRNKSMVSHFARSLALEH